MLDLNHPHSKHVFAAAGAEGAVLTAAKRMSAAARNERVRLRDACAPAFAELRRLAHDEFADCPAILPAIDALEQAVAELAALPNVPEEGTPAEYECPSCGARLERLGKSGFPAPLHPTDIYCMRCTDIIMPSLSVLRSCENGFGTDAI